MSIKVYWSQLTAVVTGYHIRAMAKADHSVDSRDLMCLCSSAIPSCSSLPRKVLTAVYELWDSCSTSCVFLQTCLSWCKAEGVLYWMLRVQSPCHNFPVERPLLSILLQLPLLDLLCRFEMTTNVQLRCLFRHVVRFLSLGDAKVLLNR